MKIHVCKYCGGALIFQDATYNVNDDSFSTFDDMTCDGCGANSDDLTIEVEVPDDFNFYEDTFDLASLESDDPESCATCSGSGEGMYDGTRCPACGGKGVIVERDYEDEIDRLEYEEDR